MSDLSITLNNSGIRDTYYLFAYPYLIYCVELWGYAGDNDNDYDNDNENFIFNISIDCR